jgi:hypothetical protein
VGFSGHRYIRNLVVYFLAIATAEILIVVNILGEFEIGDLSYNSDGKYIGYF